MRDPRFVRMREIESLPENEQSKRDFKNALMLDEAKALLAGQDLTCAERKGLSMKVTRLNHYLTPPAKMAAIKRYRPVVAEVLAILRRGETTITDVINQLDQKGLLADEKSATGEVLGDRAVRATLQRVFGTRKPGRPPGKGKPPPG